MMNIVSKIKVATTYIYPLKSLLLTRVKLNKKDVLIMKDEFIEFLKNWITTDVDPNSHCPWHDLP